MHRLDAFLDKQGVLRVGGRLTQDDAPYHVKQPVILPKKRHITVLVIRHYHERIIYQEREMTLNKLRANGFLMTGGSSAVTHYIFDCVPCKKLRGASQEQKITDLSDRGTNLVGARNELKEARKELSKDSVQSFLLQNECDWIEFKTNAPAASHMSGGWERQIAIARNILNALFNQSRTQLYDESLNTFMCETEAIVNSRPLTTDNLTSNECEPLTPNHLLTVKSVSFYHYSENFRRQIYIYLVKRWRRVKYLVNQFWSRWRKQFLYYSQQQRQKWMHPRRNMQKRNIVFLKEDNVPRNLWRLARVDEAYTDQDGFVRKLKTVVSGPSLNAKGRTSSSQNSFRTTNPQVSVRYF